MKSQSGKDLIGGHINEISPSGLQTKCIATAVRHDHPSETVRPRFIDASISRLSLRIFLYSKKRSKMSNYPRRRRKLEVFIGSTFREHKIEREELIRAINSMGHIPSGMELWDADPKPLEETLKQKLDEADVHILLVGVKYGSLVPEGSDLLDSVKDLGVKSRISYTHWEYLKSVKDGRPIIAFIAKPPDSGETGVPLRSPMPPEQLQSSFTGQQSDPLDEFREQVTKSRFCKYYLLESEAPGIVDPGNLKRRLEAQVLARNVSAALNEIDANEQLAPDSAGWIRADSDEAGLVREVRNNRFLKRILDRLRQFNVMTERVLASPDEKAMAAQLFWKKLTGPIRRSGRQHLFFESGSTIAHVSEEFENYVLAKISGRPAWKVWTNNVEVLLQLALYTDVEVVAFPSCSPDPRDKYGAIFEKTFFEVDEPGPWESRSLYRASDYQPSNGTTKTESEWSVVEEARHALMREIQKGRAIVCVTASGLHHKPDETEAWRLGPHTGSHPNMLFKRAVYMTGEPTVIFLDESKIGNNFQVGDCFPVFLEDHSWLTFKRNACVALCIGYSVPIRHSADKETADRNEMIQKKRNEMQTLMMNLGIKTIIANEVLDRQGKDPIGAIIGANKKFVETLQIHR